jgi:transcriptional regulator with XRE-family HTH domain
MHCQDDDLHFASCGATKGEWRVDDEDPGAEGAGRKAVATRLKWARRAAGYATAREFAQAHGITKGTYDGHEAGSRGLMFKGTAERYADLLDVSLDWLLTGKGDGPAATGEKPQKSIAHMIVKNAAALEPVAAIRAGAIIAQTARRRLGRGLSPLSTGGVNDSLTTSEHPVGIAKEGRIDVKNETARLIVHAALELPPETMLDVGLAILERATARLETARPHPPHGA